MSPFRRALLMLTLLLPVSAPAALPGPLAEDQEQNRRRLAALEQKDPAEHARLRQAARAFLALPEDQRQRLVQLDRELHEQAPAVQAHLRDVLQRYADWLEALPTADRKDIEDAPTRQERLQRIRALRERQWLQTLPRAARDRLAKLEGQARSEAVARLRHEERQQRRDWQIAARLWEALTSKRAAHNLPLPAQLSDLEFADRSYVDHVLRPLLSAAQWERLEKAQGQWPRFGRVLVELADAHPPALDGPHGPTRIKDLPLLVRERLKLDHKQDKKGIRAALKKQEGKWPEFAVAVTKAARVAKVALPHDFWPSRREDLSEPMKKFLQDRLGPTLDQGERVLLLKTEGSWPAYPHTIQDLAGRHSLTVPWQTFPGPRSRWDGYRLDQPVADAPPPRRRPRVANKS